MQKHATFSNTPKPARLYFVHLPRNVYTKQIQSLSNMKEAAVCTFIIIIMKGRYGMAQLYAQTDADVAAENVAHRLCLCKYF